MAPFWSAQWALTRFRRCAQLRLDLDNDGIFETPGQSALFSAANLFAPSSYTIRVQVTDIGGLTAVDLADVFVIFNWAGFFSPVQNPPMVNEVNAGSSIPLKFSLGGFKGVDIFAPGYPISVQADCSTWAALDSSALALNLATAACPMIRSPTSTTSSGNQIRAGLGPAAWLW